MSQDSFIESVWDKVEELEYIEKEKRIIRENQREILKEKIILGLLFLGIIGFMVVVLKKSLAINMEDIVKVTAFIALVIGSVIHNRLETGYVKKGREVVAWR